MENMDLRSDLLSDATDQVEAPKAKTPRRNKKEDAAPTPPPVDLLSAMAKAQAPAVPQQSAQAVFRTSAPREGSVEFEGSLVRTIFSKGSTGHMVMGLLSVVQVVDGERVPGTVACTLFEDSPVTFVGPNGDVILATEGPNGQLLRGSDQKFAFLCGERAKLHTHGYITRGTKVREVQEDGTTAEVMRPGYRLTKVRILESTGETLEYHRATNTREEDLYARYGANILVVEPPARNQD